MLFVPFSPCKYLTPQKQSGPDALKLCGALILLTDRSECVCVCVRITAGYGPSRHHTELQESNSLRWIGTPSTPFFTAGPFRKP